MRAVISLENWPTSSLRESFADAHARVRSNYSSVTEPIRSRIRRIRQPKMIENSGMHASRRKSTDFISKALEHEPRRHLT